MIYYLLSENSHQYHFFILNFCWLSFFLFKASFNSFSLIFFCSEIFSFSSSLYTLCFDLDFDFFDLDDFTDLVSSIWDLSWLLTLLFLLSFNLLKCLISSSNFASNISLFRTVSFYNLFMFKVKLWISSSSIKVFTLETEEDGPFIVLK